MLENKTLLLGILAYTIAILLLIGIHRLLLKTQKKYKKNLTFLYDTLRYEIAYNQQKNTTIQEQKGINIIMKAEQKNYKTNAQIIKDEVIKIESQLGKQIISTDERNTIERQSKKEKSITIIVQIIGRINTVGTVGIYKLFW